MKPYTLLFILALLVCFAQVWLPQYFLTGDGATHVYNAAMLRDKWLNHYQQFYADYYTLNAKVDPNWFSHIVLALLTMVFSGAVAEKVLISLYIVMYATGFRKLVQLAGGSQFLVITGMLLIINHTLVKGFYNFNFSIALSMWLVCAWVLFLRNSSIKHYIAFVAAAVVTFFAHAVGLMYGMILCLLLTAPEVFAGAGLQKKRWLSFGKKLLLFLLGVMPLVWLVFDYSSRHSSGVDITFHADRWRAIFAFHEYQSHTSAEATWAMITGYSLVTSLVVFLAIAGYRRELRPEYLAGVLFVCIALVVYFFIPEAMAGGSMLDMRTRQVFYLSLAVGLIYLPVKPLVAKLTGVVFFLLFCGISVARFPVLMTVGEGADEYLSVTGKVRPKSALLALSFSHNGQNADGSYISDRNWLFQHATGYAGADKPLAIMDNYATNTGYFAFTWKAEANPYNNLSVSPGHEDQRPNADILRYERESGTDIDYIVTWCYDSSYRDAEHVDSLLTFIEKNYRVAAVSSQKRQYCTKDFPAIEAFNPYIRHYFAL